MSLCNQSTITDKLYQYLTCLETLNMSDCNQKNSLIPIISIFKRY